MLHLFMGHLFETFRSSRNYPIVNYLSLKEEASYRQSRLSIDGRSDRKYIFRGIKISVVLSLAIETSPLFVA